VHLNIYDLSGQKIETLVNGYQTSGEHEVTWTAEGLSSGIYFYRLQTGQCSDIKKLILLK